MEPLLMTPQFSILLIKTIQEAKKSEPLYKEHLS